MKEINCKDVELTLTDVAVGRYSPLKKTDIDNLIKHLCQCKKCRDEFEEWQDILADINYEEHSKTPAYKKMIAGVIEKFKKGIPRKKK